jgi:folate-binding protein YgfZ
MGVDIDENTIPQETGLVPQAVDLTKGCFLGQELVARIDSRGGHTPRRLMGVMITTNVIPPAGAEIVADDKQVGSLTSPSESLVLRAPVGLSLLRREVEAGDPVTVRWGGGEAQAVVADLPLVG